MNHPLLARFRTGQFHPLGIGLVSFATTVALVLFQPGAAIA
jgi:hypothetical protein